VSAMMVTSKDAMILIFSSSTSRTTRACVSY